MPYLLRSGSTGSGEYVSLTAPVSIPSSTPFKITFRQQGVGAGFIRTCGNSGTTSNRILIFGGTNGTCRINLGGSDLNFATSGFDSTNDNVYVFERNIANLVTLTINGVPSASTFTNSNAMSFSWILTQNTTGESRIASDLYYFNVDINSVPTHAYAGVATGTTLPDSISSNDGTLISYDGTTDSWWVSYGGAAAQNVDMNLASATPLVYSPEIVTSQEIEMTIVSGTASVYDFDVLSEQFIDFEIASGTTTVYLMEVLSGVTEIEMEPTSATPSVLSPEILAGVVEVFPDLVDGITEVYELQVEYTQYIDADLTNSETEVYLHQVYIISEDTGQFLGGFGILQFIYWDV